MPFTRPSLSQREIINVEELRVSSRRGAPTGVSTVSPDEPVDPMPEQVLEPIRVPTGLRVVEQTVSVRNGQVFVDVVVEYEEVPGYPEINIRVVPLDR